MTGATLDDPLFDRYKKLGCSISTVEKDTDDYKMVTKYLQTTYEPIKVGDIVRSLVTLVALLCAAANYMHICKRLLLLPSHPELWSVDRECVCC